MSIRRVWLDWFLVIFLGHLSTCSPQDTQLFFSTLLSQNLCLLHSLRSLEFGFFELISGLHILGSNFRVHMATSQVKTLSKRRFPGNFPSQPRSGSKKKASLTNLSIPPLLLGYVLKVQSPLQSVNLNQDTTSPLHQCVLLLNISGKGYAFHSYPPIHAQCLTSTEIAVFCGRFTSSFFPSHIH